MTRRRLLSHRRSAVPALGERLVLAPCLAHRENGTRGIAHDSLRDAAEQSMQPTRAPMRPDDDEVVVASAGDLDDLAEGIADLVTPRHARPEPRLGRLDRALCRLLERATSPGFEGRRGTDTELVRSLDAQDLDRGVTVLRQRDRVLERSEGGR